MDGYPTSNISRRSLAALLSTIGMSWFSGTRRPRTRSPDGASAIRLPYDIAEGLPNGSLGTDGCFNVRDFGAKVDGKTDDLAAYHATLLACAAAGGGIVEISAGTMLVSALPAYPPGVPIRVRGAGRFRTTIKHKTGGALVDWTARHLPSEFGCGFEDLSFDGGNTASSVVTLTNHSLFHMARVTISAGGAPGTGTALRIVSLFDSHFSDIYVTDCGSASTPCVILDSLRSHDDSCNNVQFYNLHIEPTDCDAIYLDLRGNSENAVEENKFWGLKLHGNSKTGNPSRALLNLSEHARANEFDGSIFAFGKGIAQVVCEGQRNVFSGGSFGIRSSNPPMYAILCTPSASHNVWECPNFMTPKAYASRKAVFRGEAGSVQNKLLYPRGNFGGDAPFSDAGRNCAIWDDTAVNKGLQLYHAEGISTGFPPGFVQTTEWINVLVDEPTIETNAALGDAFEVTLGGHRRMAAPSNSKRGQTITYEIIQDATGGWTVTWDPVFKTAWSNAGNQQEKRSLVSFRYNGANWVQRGAQGPFV